MVGPVPDAPAGCFMCAGLSGYGVMASNGAGELLAAHVAGPQQQRPRESTTTTELAVHVAGSALPEAYAESFAPSRWLDREYCAAVARGGYRCAWW